MHQRNGAKTEVLATGWLQGGGLVAQWTVLLLDAQHPQRQRDFTGFGVVELKLIQLVKEE